MKSFILTCLILSVSLTTFAQKPTKVQLSEQLTTEKHQVSNFTGIDISSDFKAYVTFGSETSLEIKSNENMHAHIVVKQKDDMLVITEKDNLWLKGDQTLEAHITVPTLDYIKGSEDAIIVLKNELVANSLKLVLDEDSTIEGELTLKTLDIDLDEDSYATVSGRADKVSGKLKEDSEFKNYDFVIGDLDLTLIEDSVAELTVLGEMSLNLMGDSEMSFKGNPTIKRKIIVGDSELRQVNK